MSISADTLHPPSSNKAPGNPKRKLIDHVIDAAARPFDRRLGKWLSDNGTLSEDDFRRILAVQREHGERFSDVALRLGLVSELDVRRALAQQCELPAVLPDSATYHRRLVAAYYPFSKRSEAIRTLRTELMLRWFMRGHHCVAIGETRRHEGAATLAANVAWSCAQLGHRTLVIDANLRHPLLNTLFKLSPKLGLTDFLKGVCNVEDCLMTAPGLNHLTLMFSGKPPGNPQELLSLGSFGYLMESVADNFDVVVVMGPPILECADMQIITAQVGGYVLTVHRHRTHLTDIEHAQAKLACAAAEMIGLVLDG